MYEDEEELSVAEVLVTLAMATVAVVVIVGVAVTWNAISLASQALQAVRHKP